MRFTNQKNGAPVAPSESSRAASRPPRAAPSSTRARAASSAQLSPCAAADGSCSPRLALRTRPSASDRSPVANPLCSSIQRFALIPAVAYPARRKTSGSRRSRWPSTTGRQPCGVRAGARPARRARQQAGEHRRVRRQRPAGRAVRRARRHDAARRRAARPPATRRRAAPKGSSASRARRVEHEQQDVRHGTIPSTNGHLEDLLVHDRPVAEVAVLAEQLAVVGGDDHPRVRAAAGRTAARRRRRGRRTASIWRVVQLAQRLAGRRTRSRARRSSVARRRGA